MSLSINESIDLHFQCKGNWMTYPHFVIPNKPMKLNEKLGHCSVCWNIEAKQNNYAARQEPLHKSLNFKQCGEDTL